MNKPIALFPFGLMGVNIALAILLIVQSIPSPHDLGEFVLQAPARDVEIKRAPEYLPPARESFDVLAEKPPFSPTRQPDKTVANSADEGESMPPDILLLGLISSDSLWTAVVKPPHSDEVWNIRQGELIEGWQIADINRERIVLQAGDKRSEIWLDGERRHRSSSGISFVPYGIAADE